MTPAIQLLKKRAIAFTLHPYEHDPNNTHFGEEAAQKLGVSLEQTFKTLMVATADKPIGVMVLPVSHQLSLKKAAKALGVKKLELAPLDMAQKSSGYLVGGISPLAQKKALPTWIDESAKNWDVIYISGGKRGLDVALRADDLATLTRGQFTDLLDEA
ncbi:Cys-tRNA(Pro) deacylase [Pasteurellaceae bacterium TAE3-ERU1]|uniref:Cys-tRNA(Pro) deacylase n=1 Tax=Spirabiliibacterium mucosae TaxID=28156 RepID=UPI001AAD4D9E|nr:Cys-tRNA(Pro) deacylase [Spirabiliibacterium mucosae]MBE2898436.1 Cys-tRNA(Pro) deacylase [Spirabiliibacterium mucosae]MBV7387283.1 Cys-tRNA(Pro) deacylase [Pasteurellaceae bacterium TAE3-ERU1]